MPILWLKTILKSKQIEKNVNLVQFMDMLIIDYEVRQVFTDFIDFLRRKCVTSKKRYFDLRHCSWSWEDEELYLICSLHHCIFIFIFWHFFILQAEQKKRKIWKLVLTGGPCGGKTTGQARISTFFENLGWKVYRYIIWRQQATISSWTYFRVPETATVLLGGGVNFAELSERAQIEFQVCLLFTNLLNHLEFYWIWHETILISYFCPKIPSIVPRLNFIF